MKADKHEKNTSKSLLPAECKYNKRTEDKKDVDIKVSIISQKEVKKAAIIPGEKMVFSQEQRP